MDTVTTLATERMEEQEDTGAEGGTQNRCYPLKLADTHQNLKNKERVVCHDRGHKIVDVYSCSRARAAGPYLRKEQWAGEEGTT